MEKKREGKNSFLFISSCFFFLLFPFLLQCICWRHWMLYSLKPAVLYRRLRPCSVCCIRNTMCLFGALSERFPLNFRSFILLLLRVFGFSNHRERSEQGLLLLYSSNPFCMDFYRLQFTWSLWLPLALVFIYKEEQDEEEEEQEEGNQLKCLCEGNDGWVEFFAYFFFFFTFSSLEKEEIYSPTLFTCTRETFMHIPRMIQQDKETGMKRRGCEQGSCFREKRVMFVEKERCVFLFLKKNEKNLKRIWRTSSFDIQDTCSGDQSLFPETGLSFFFRIKRLSLFFLQYMPWVWHKKPETEGCQDIRKRRKRKRERERKKKNDRYYEYRFLMNDHKRRLFLFYFFLLSLWRMTKLEDPAQVSCITPWVSLGMSCVWYIQVFFPCLD